MRDTLSLSSTERPIGYDSEPEVPFEMHIQSLYGIDSPLYAALTLDLARGLPLSFNEVSIAKKAGWGKEISVLETGSPEPRVNWRLFFDPERFDEPLLPELEPSPEGRQAAQKVYKALCWWREKESRKIHYPRASFKNMSRSTTRNWELYTGREWDRDKNPIFGQTDWMKNYHQTGVKLGGSMEIRQKWYTSGAKPRTYAANGGEVYGVSLCLQDFFGDLVDILPVCNHKTRLRPARLRMKSGQFLRIYDLEAFTSRMHEQKNLIDELALFCRGEPFTYMDVREGIITRDMGEVIWEYNNTANRAVETSYERVGEEFSTHVGRHYYASLLGIFGNLMSCTFGHAIAVLWVVGDEDKVNVAGDDAAVVVDEHIESEVLNPVVAAIGIDEETKRFRSDEAGAICLKRPIYQYGTTVEQGFLVIPPKLMMIAETFNGYSDPRYPPAFEQKTTTQRYTMVGKELMRFLRSVYRAESILTFEEKFGALELTRRISELFGVTSTTGHFPPCGSEYFWPAFLSDNHEAFELSVQDYFMLDPLHRLVRNHYSGFAIVNHKEELQDVELDTVRSAGQQWFSNGSRHLKLLEQLGYIEREAQTRSVEGLYGRDVLIKEYESEVPVVYQFTCIADVPDILLI